MFCQVMLRKDSKVIFLSETDVGGAGTAANDLMLALYSEGVNVKMIVLKKSSHNPNVVELGFVFRLYRKIYKYFLSFLLRGDKNKYQMYGLYESFNLVSTRTLIRYFKFNPTHIFVFWVSAFVNAKNLYELNQKYKSKVFIFFMDKAPFSGGCHYNLSCQQFINNSCKSCDGIIKDFFGNTPENNFNFKTKYLKALKPTLVFSTSEISSYIKLSPIYRNFSRLRIPLHVDLNHFYPLNEDKEVNVFKRGSELNILIGATSFAQERKGLRYLKSALRLIIKIENKHLNSLSFIVIGDNDLELGIEDKCRVYKLGFINSSEELGHVYRRAHIFLNTSIDDCGPLMLLQAMASGCIPVSYNIGIARDVVKNNHSGYLVENMNSNDFAMALSKAINLTDDSRKAMSYQASEIVRENYQWDSIRSKYIRGNRLQTSPI